MARCELGKDKDCTGEATHIVQNEETEMRCCGPCADHAPGNATVEKELVKRLQLAGVL